MADLTDNFEALTDVDFIVDVAVAFSAFVAPMLYVSAVEVVAARDIANEFACIAHIVAAEKFGGNYKTEVQVASGLYTVNELAGRYGLQSKIRGML